MVLSDVLKLYEDSSILRYRLAVKFDGEAGLDSGGVTKDLFCTFWESAWDKYFDGDSVKVPFVAPQNIASSKSVFQALGRLLIHGWILTNQIPIRFCEASLITAIHGQDAVADEVLVQSFYLYISQFERDILQNLMSGRYIPQHNAKCTQRYTTVQQNQTEPSSLTKPNIPS